MKRIAIHLSLALSLLTIPGYAQKVDSIDFQYLQSKSQIENLLSKRLDDKNFQEAIRDITKSLDASKRSESLHLKENLKSYNRGGVDSGGGGTLVRTQQAVGLLDLYLYNAKAFNSSESGVILPETPSYRDHGFDALVNSKSSIVSKTLLQIEKWKASSPIITNLIQNALKELPIYYVDGKLNFKDQMIFVPNSMSFPEGSIRLGAYYLKDMGVIVEKNAFDGLSLKNQMGLLVHEALRHRQLSFDSGMNNEVIQKLTAQVMSEPQKGVTLDRVIYLNGRILEKAIRVAELRIQAKEKSESLCRKRPNFCQVLTGPIEEILKYYGTLSKSQLTNEFFEQPRTEIDRELDFRREFAELTRILRTLSFETSSNTEIFEELNFSLKNSHGMFRMAAIAKIYNDSGKHDSAEAEALRSFMESLKEMGTLID